MDRLGDEHEYASQSGNDVVQKHASSPISRDRRQSISIVLALISYRPNRSVIEPPKKPPIIPPTAKIDTANELSRRVTLQRDERKKERRSLQNQGYARSTDVALWVTSVTRIIDESFDDLAEIKNFVKRSARFLKHASTYVLWSIPRWTKRNESKSSVFTSSLFVWLTSRLKHSQNGTMYHWSRQEQLTEADPLFPNQARFMASLKKTRGIYLRRTAPVLYSRVFFVGEDIGRAGRGSKGAIGIFRWSTIFTSKQLCGTWTVAHDSSVWKEWRLLFQKQCTRHCTRRYQLSQWIESVRLPRSTYSLQSNYLLSGGWKWNNSEYLLDSFLLALINKRILYRIIA